jgi:hypothetical protein
MEHIYPNELDDDKIHNIIDDLMYMSYAYNRKRFPDIKPDRYTAIFGADAYLMEIKFQEDIKNGI